MKNISIGMLLALSATSASALDYKKGEDFNITSSISSMKFERYVSRGGSAIFITDKHPKMLFLVHPDNNPEITGMRLGDALIERVGRTTTMSPRKEMVCNWHQDLPQEYKAFICRLD